MQPKLLISCLSILIMSIVQSMITIAFKLHNIERGMDSYTYSALGQQTVHTFLFSYYDCNILPYKDVIIRNLKLTSHRNLWRFVQIICCYFSFIKMFKYFELAKNIIYERVTKKINNIYSFVVSSIKQKKIMLLIGNLKLQRRKSIIGIMLPVFSKGSGK